MSSPAENREEDHPRQGPGSLTRTDVQGPATDGDVDSPAIGGQVIVGGKRIPYAGAGGVFAVGIASVVGATQLGYWEGGPGPGFLPLWIGVLLAVLAVVWAVQISRATAVPARDGGAAGGRRDAVLVVVALAVAVALLDLIGYQLDMFLLVLFVLLVVGRRKWWLSLIFAAASGFGVYAVFANALQVYLPTASLSLLAQLGL